MGVHLEKQIFPPTGGGKGSGRAETVSRRGNGGIYLEVLRRDCPLLGDFAAS